MEHEVLENIVKRKKTVPTIVIIFAVINYLILSILILALVYSFIISLVGTLTITKGGGFYLYIIISTLYVGILVMAFVGVIKMHRGSRKGFILYAIGFGLIALTAVAVNFGSFGVKDELVSNLIIAGVCVLFIIIFATQLKRLN
ncbi:MAG: hypothetical protein GQ574_15135 [Crocinitomix sp.]|nr:hypothetical protein [Crocinitomix sp.]